MMTSHPGYTLMVQEDKLLPLLPKKNGSLLTPATKSHSPLSCQVLSPTRSYLPCPVPCGVLGMPASPALAAQLLILFFPPFHRAVSQAAGIRKGLENTPALQLLVADHLQCTEGSVFCQAHDKVGRCVSLWRRGSEEEPLPQAACDAGARGRCCQGPAAGRAQRMKTGSSLSCVHNVEKGLLKAPHTWDGFADICCSPARSKPPHTRIVSAPCPWSWRPPALPVPILLLPRALS